MMKAGGPVKKLLIIIQGGDYVSLTQVVTVDVGGKWSDSEICRNMKRSEFKDRAINFNMRKE